MLKLRSLALELTPRCNQQCVYCYNAWRGGEAPPEAELTTTEWCDLIGRAVDEAGIEQVTLTGGEPFLRDDVLDIIDAAAQRGLSVAIISNAGVVDAELAGALAARDVAYVQVTLGGATAAARRGPSQFGPTGQTANLPALGRGGHDALCGTGSFERTTRGVACLVAAGVPVGGSYLCTRANAARAEAVLEAMWARDIRHHIAFNRFNPSGHAAERAAELMPTRSEILTALEAAERFAADHDLTTHCTMPIPHCMVDEEAFPHVSFGECSAGTEQAEYAVTPQGRLKLCTLQQGTLGSLLESNLPELLARGGAERFRAAVPAFCEECPHRSGCLGGCGAAAEWVLGSASELDPFLAQHVGVDLADRVAILGRTRKREGGHGP